MVTVLLLFIIYAIFIGLGLPDSVLGAAWPKIYAELNLPIGYASFITTVISAGTALASFFSAKAINRFGTGVVTAFSTVMTAAALLGFSFGQSIWWLILLGIPLGLGAGAIDAALNNYVAVRYSAKSMNFLHCFYGVGVSVSPYILSFFLDGEGGWRTGFRVVFLIQAVIAVISILALPLWKKAKAKETKEEDFTPRTLSLKEMLKMPAVRVAWIVFFTTCALEFTCGIWGCTYLVEAENMLESSAAKYITLYYVGITVGRLVSGLIAGKLSPEKIVFIGYGIVGVAIVALFLPIPATIKGVTLLMIGLGNGPTFPNLTHLTPKYFKKELSQSLVGMQMLFCNLGILAMPPLFGALANYFGLWLFPVFNGVTYALMLIFTIVYVKMPKLKGLSEIS